MSVRGKQSNEILFLLNPKWIIALSLAFDDMIHLLSKIFVSDIVYVGLRKSNPVD